MTVTITSSLLFLHSLKDSQNLNEEINYVEVKVDRSQDVLLRWQFIHQHVCVEHNERRKQEGTRNGIHQLKCLTVEEKLKKRRQWG